MHIMTGEMQKNLLKELKKIPNIGPKLAADLLYLGVTSVEELKNSHPDALYYRLNVKLGYSMEPETLYRLRAAIYWISTTHPQEEKKQWWTWKE